MLATWMYWPWTGAPPLIPPLPIHGKGAVISAYSAAGKLLQPSGSGTVIEQDSGSGKMLS